MTPGRHSVPLHPMNTTLPPAAMAAGRFIRLTVLLLMAVVIVGCGGGGSQSSPDDVEVFGSAAKGGNPEAGKVWQATLEAWPKQGNLSILYGTPNIQAEFENWMNVDETRPLVKPSEMLLPVFEKLKAFDDPLIALKGGWGPLPEPDKVRGMSVRGMRKTLWADLRESIADEDTERVADLLVVMCNLPRVSHAFDGTTRGLIATLGTCDAIGWGMRDALVAGIDFSDEQKTSIRKASSWLEKSDALGAVDPLEDPRRANILDTFQKKTLPRIMKIRSELLG